MREVLQDLLPPHFNARCCLCQSDTTKTKWCSVFFVQYFFVNMLIFVQFLRIILENEIKLYNCFLCEFMVRGGWWVWPVAPDRVVWAPVTRGPKIPNIGIFKMQPKIVVVLVMGTTEHLEFSLILQKWPSTLHLNFWVRVERKTG